MIGFFGLIGITGMIFFAWYLFFSHAGLRGKAVSDRCVASLIMGSTQIILSEIGLGHFGYLTVGRVILFNICFSGFVLMFTFWKCGRPLSGVFGVLLNEAKGIGSWWRGAKGWENYVLLSFLGVLMLWFGCAAYLLPPRSYDDVYHLPPVFEYLINHRIFLLPLEVRAQFAFPENGEFLFLWTLLFLHDARAVDLVQMAMALIGVLVIYHSVRRLGGTRRLALFMGLLFPFIPVVIGQGASSNIDLIVSVFFLAALGMAVCFWKEGRLAYFYLTGTTCGLLMGMKYSMVLFGMGLQPLLFYPFFKGIGEKRLVYGSVYIFLLVLGGGYWYIRNWIVLENPVWPFEI